MNLNEVIPKTEVKTINESDCEHDGATHIEYGLNGAVHVCLKCGKETKK